MAQLRLVTAHLENAGLRHAVGGKNFEFDETGRGGDGGL